MLNALKLIDSDTKMEFPFSKFIKTTRKYRADFFLPNLRLIIEVNGGQYNQGRHTRAGKIKNQEYTQYENDLTKLNLAQFHGYRVFQFTYQMMERKDHLQLIEKIYKSTCKR